MGGSRGIYDDRLRKRNNYFEIPAFLQIERGKSRAFDFEFPALEVPCLKFKKAAISK